MFAPASVSCGAAGCLESLPILQPCPVRAHQGRPAAHPSDGYGLGRLGRGAAGPDRLCTTTAAEALRVIV